MPSTLVISDLHLHPFKTGSELSPSQRGARALLGLLEHYPSANLTLAGDIFDFTLWNASVEAALTAFDALYPDLFQELRRRLARGQLVTLVPGNHDAVLAEPQSWEAFSRALGSPHARVAPWFQRIGSAHIEHGHQFDVDNAFVHPLAPHNPATEPLGTALMRRFVGPSNAHVFAHGHTTTLISGLGLAITHFGPRAPLVVGRYFQTAFSLLSDTIRRKETRAVERQLGEDRIEHQAQETGLKPAELLRLAEACPVPRHTSFGQTWMRLYFDRVLATTTTGFALSRAIPLASSGVATWAVLLVSLGYLGGSVLHRRERYKTGPGGAQANAAAQIRSLTGAHLVVMGHSHQAYEETGYINLGSFTFCRGARRYVLLDEAGGFEIGTAPL